MSSCGVNETLGLTSENAQWKTGGVTLAYRYSVQAPRYLDKAIAPILTANVRGVVFGNRQEGGAIQTIGVPIEPNTLAAPSVTECNEVQ